MTREDLLAQVVDLLVTLPEASEAPRAELVKLLDSAPLLELQSLDRILRQTMRAVAAQAETPELDRLRYKLRKTLKRIEAARGKR